MSTHRYAELHAHSAYSFLDGANEPAELVQAAAYLALDALALTDHDGMPGIVKHAQAGRELGVPTVHGAELTLADGAHLPVLARDPQAYRRLVAAISAHNLQAGERQEPAHKLETLAGALTQGSGSQGAGGTGRCLVLTGTSRGPLRRALGDPNRPEIWNLPAADRCLGQLVDLFGAADLAVELSLDGGPTDAALTQALSGLAAAYKLPLLATGAVRCAKPADSRLADVLTANRLGTDLEGARAYLGAVGRWLRSPQDMAYLHRRAPYAVDAAAEYGRALAFDLSLVTPELPKPQVPDGHTPATWLRELTRRGALERYGARSQDPHAWEVLDHELAVIEALGFPGYFLIVRSIVDFCESAGILCQGRGSAANSAVCYALGITAVDAVRHQMLFERFLSPGRKGYPDIDLDIEACRREEVIQHVYSHYGREQAAQVANVISYRPRSALRDAARALGYPPGIQDHWAKSIEHRWDDSEHNEADDSPVPAQVLAVAKRLLRLPRHLGVHPGGMVLADRPITGVCPVRWAAIEGRSVLQWDKDDCAQAGLVKFDLLGLGMLTALRLAFTSLSQRGETVPELAPGGVLRPAQTGRPWGLHTLPEDDPAVYRLLQAADTVGVFQVESRAQMATLPRLRPACFYDIVVEVALIRPGPIQGKAVNPYIRRRLGREPVTYLHESLRPALAKTLGVPLFQEQLMQIAVDTAGFSPAEADSLRQAMGAKRSTERMEALHTRLVEGMMRRGIEAATAETIFSKLRAFADFGFPESHAFSFAYLVYASAWLKVRKPEDFYAGVLAAQPMGFWSPQTLVADARRHGVRVLPACVNASAAQASVEQIHGAAYLQAEGEAVKSRAAAGHGSAGTPAPEALSCLDTHPELAVRLGLAPIKGIGAKTAEKIVAERQAHGPYRDVADLARRVALSRSRLEILAACGALDSLGLERREALWAAGPLALEHGGMQAVTSRQPLGRKLLSAPESTASLPWIQPPLPGTAVGAKSPKLPPMPARERSVTDLVLTGTTTGAHPMTFLRAALDEQGVLRAAEVIHIVHGTRVEVAGIVTHRQRPHTAVGTVFLNLEDESGLLNIICSPGVWRRFRAVGRRASALVVRGIVESGDGVTAIRADRLEALPGVASTRSRDWC
ncbi:DNA polymerase III subunit alpha [Actinomyces bovis]|uniref:Error-prone DNA polymerase n=1 Tax=Actinomyces bovis TaxID=1658 RepID=A0ABY1VKJ0_9ACTO|nr:error-prone DNA polymerase [Actinomyces bovis]SPT52419.1 DNA polymerase III subunit alpha [Actinomyces bovis]VEG54046.1 DNA polymerase III subunit alpha [Actinomyces israelii]